MVWIPFIISAAQGLSQGLAAKRSTEEINRAQSRFEKLNMQLANADMLQGYAATAARRIQERKSLFNSLEQVSLDATRRIGAVSVASGASGLHGNSSAALVNDFKRAQLKSEGNILDTEKYMQEQYRRDIAAIRATATSRILTGQKQRVQGPDYMQIAMNALAGFIKQKQTIDAANKYQGQTVTNKNVPNISTPGGIPPRAPNSGLDLPDLG